jgi:hypothetical protein
MPRTTVQLVQGEWGLTEDEEEQEQARRQEFVASFIPTTRSQLRVLAESYQVCCINS